MTFLNGDIDAEVRYTPTGAVAPVCTSLDNTNVYAEFVHVCRGLMVGAVNTRVHLDEKDLSSDSMYEAVRTLHATK